MNETDILEWAIDTYGKDAQLKMVIEEMSELTKEICKHFRGANNIQNIAEEVADVKIMLDQLEIIFDMDVAVWKARVMKIERLRQRLAGETASENA